MKPFNVFPYDSNIQFMRLRWISLAIAALIMFVAIGAMVFKGFNFALDFTGGTSVQLGFDQPASVDALRARLAANGYGSAQVQTLGSGRELLVRLQPKPGVALNDTSQTAEDVLRIASTPDNPARMLKSGYVGPQVGKELALNGLYALLFVLLNLEAWSLMIGSVLLFAALAGVMFATRNVDWASVGRREAGE